MTKGLTLELTPECRISERALPPASGGHMHQHQSCGCGKSRTMHAASKPLCNLSNLRPTTLSISAATPISSDTPACCSGDSPSGPASEAEEESDRRVARTQQSTQQFSWRVSGMDCPSCARTIETAVRHLPDVAAARILFPVKSWWSMPIVMCKLPLKMQ